jgi:hypothetical protein
MNLIYVDLKQTSTRWPLRRPQRWYWVALNGNNMRRMARSSEMYTNQQDCIAAIQQLFGQESNVYLRRHEMGNAMLRMAA